MTKHKPKRPASVSKKLWRKASKKDREWIIWHEYQHELARTSARMIRHTDTGKPGIYFLDELFTSSARQRRILGPAILGNSGE